MTVWRTAVVLKAGSGSLTYNKCDTCQQKLARAAPQGGRRPLGAVYCETCRTFVAASSAFALPLTLVGLGAGDTPQPQTVVALGGTVALLLGCDANEFRRLQADRGHPDLGKLVAKMLEGRRFWVRSKEGRKRKKAYRSQPAGSARDDVAVDLLPLEPHPPLVATAVAMLKRVRATAASAHAAPAATRRQTPSLPAWSVYSGGDLTYATGP
jgi:hypothetical protein